MQLAAVYLVQDPRARLADLKKTKTFRNSRGETRQWTDKSHQLVIPALCGDMLGSHYHSIRVMHHIPTLTCLDSIEYLSGSKVSAPGLRLVSVRFEDLVQDLELEVGGNITFSRYFILQHKSVSR